MRKKIFVVFLSFIIFLTGCGSTKEKNTGKKIDELEGKIKILVYEDYKGYINDSINLFKNKHPKVNFQVEILDENKVEISLSQGKYSDLGQIIMAPSSRLNYYIKKYPESFLEISSNLNVKDNFSKTRLEYNYVNDKVYGVPLDNRPLILYYRKDLFQGKDIDIKDIKSWEEFINLGNVLNKNSKGEKKLLALKEGDNLFRILLNQLNKGYLDKDGFVDIDGEESEKAFKVLEEIYREGSIYYLNNDLELISKLNQGKVYFVLSSSNLISKLESNNENYKYGTMKIPSFEPGGSRNAQVQGTNLMMVNSEGDKNLVETFIKFVTMEKISLMCAMNNHYILPANNEIYADAIFDKEIDILDKEKIWREFEIISRNSFIPRYSYRYEYIDKIVNHTYKEALEKNYADKELLIEIMKEIYKKDEEI